MRGTTRPTIVAAFQAAATRLYQLGDKDEALRFHKERKQFVQDLEYVKSQRLKGARLPAFHYSPRCGAAGARALPDACARTYTIQQSFPDIHDQELEVAVRRIGGSSRARSHRVCAQIVRGISLPLPKDYTTLDTYITAELAFPAMQAMPIPYVEPRDISNLVAFLASDESRYMTGQNIRVDAGAMLKEDHGV